jgi:hypothetical protein
MGISFVQQFLETARQWRYPQEFRILPLPIENELAQLEKLVRSFAEEAQRSRVSPPPQPSEPIFHNALDDEPFIADLATRLWRVRQAMLRSGSVEQGDGADRGFRHLDRLLAHLEEAGVKVVDKTGSFYDAGMVMNVVSSEPMDGIGREIIKETIKPAVYRGDRLIQTSQVVVGVPSLQMD